MKVRTVLLVLVLASEMAAQDSTKPRISPLFDRLDDGPAFFITCNNTSHTNVSSAASVWMRSIRIDGKVVPPEGSLFGPGLSTDVKPGEAWQGILALRQTFQSFFPSPKFGALRRSARVVVVGEGRHTLAIQCGETWSDEIEFFWDGERNP